MPSRHTDKNPGHVDRKTLQLCKQVERTVGQVLSGELNNDILRELNVLAVEPIAGTAHLMVIVEPLDPESSPPVVEILTRLQQAKVALRNAVAAAISRRKAPDLLFQVSSREACQLPE